MGILDNLRLQGLNEYLSQSQERDAQIGDLGKFENAIFEKLGNSAYTLKELMRAYDELHDRISRQGSGPFIQLNRPIPQILATQLNEIAHELANGLNHGILSESDLGEFEKNFQEFVGKDLGALAPGQFVEKKLKKKLNRFIPRNFLPGEKLSHSTPRAAHNVESHIPRQTSSKKTLNFRGQVKQTYEDSPNFLTTSFISSLTPKGVSTKKGKQVIKQVGKLTSLPTPENPFSPRAIIEDFSWWRSQGDRDVNNLGGREEGAIDKTDGKPEEYPLRIRSRGVRQ